MPTVRAFRPRRYDPPKFVGEEADDVSNLVGSFISGGQCDGCGNSTYQVRVKVASSPASRTTNFQLPRFVAVCMVDPTDDPEFRHDAPCGAVYPIGAYDEDEVEF